MLFDVEAFVLAGDPPAGAQVRPAVAAAVVPEPVVNPATTVGFVLDGADDASVAAAGRLMERGVRLRVADKPFQFDGKQFSRGSVLVTRKDNTHFAGDLTAAVREVCLEQKTSALGIRTGYGPRELPDLGGRHFVLLQPPRVAVLGREPFAVSSYGECWYVLDHVLGLRATTNSSAATIGAAFSCRTVRSWPAASTIAPG